MEKDYVLFLYGISGGDHNSFIKKGIFELCGEVGLEVKQKGRDVLVVDNTEVIFCNVDHSVKKIKDLTNVSRIYIDDYTAQKTEFDYESLTDNVTVLRYLTHHNLFTDLEKYCDRSIVKAYRYKHARNQIVEVECEKCQIDNPLTGYFSSKEKCIENMISKVTKEKIKYENEIDKLNKRLRACNEQIEGYLKLL